MSFANYFWQHYLFYFTPSGTTYVMKFNRKTRLRLKSRVERSTLCDEIQQESLFNTLEGMAAETFDKIQYIYFWAGWTI